MFIWDSSKTLFTIPGLNHPITWYGVLFAFGFFFCYLIVRQLFIFSFIQSGESKQSAKAASQRMVDRLSTYSVLGTVIGARLGHVLFYDLPLFIESPWSLFRVWEGGLASHGGALGVLLALLLFYWRSRRELPSFSFLKLLDMVVIPVGLLGALIRVGNFINQEILGIPTKLSWGVIFLRPSQPAPPVPLHPVQLYEAMGYLATFVLLLVLWKRQVLRLGEGLFAALFFLIVFSFRFWMESFKLPQSEVMDESLVTMGQLLSLPFVALGLSLLLLGLYRRRAYAETR